MASKLVQKNFGDLINKSNIIDPWSIVEFEQEKISQITYDSRDIIPSDEVFLFFAIHGQNTDRHRFIDDVFKKNKHAIVVSEKDLKGNYKRSIRVNIYPTGWTTKNSSFNRDKW